MRVVMCWSQCLGVAEHGRCQARALPRAGVTKYRRCKALVAKRQGRDLPLHIMHLSNTLKFTINYYVIFETILLDFIRNTSISLFCRILSLKPPFASHHFWILLPHEDMSNKNLFHEQQPQHSVHYHQIFFCSCLRLKDKLVQKMSTSKDRLPHFSRFLRSNRLFFRSKS